MIPKISLAYQFKSRLKRQKNHGIRKKRLDRLRVQFNSIQINPKFLITMKKLK